MNKQIEEMARDLCECMPYVVCEDRGLDCDSCKNKKMAEYLHSVGYRKQSGWISVEERLPEDTLPTDYKHKTIKVLVAIKEKNGVTVRTQKRFLDYTYEDGKRTSYWTWRFSPGKVTHWMPLPEPPKMKGGAE